MSGPLGFPFSLQSNAWRNFVLNISQELLHLEIWNFVQTLVVLCKRESASSCLSFPLFVHFPFSPTKCFVADCSAPMRARDTEGWSILCTRKQWCWNLVYLLSIFFFPSLTPMQCIGKFVSKIFQVLRIWNFVQSLRFIFTSFFHFLFSISYANAMYREICVFKICSTCIWWPWPGVCEVCSQSAIFDSVLVLFLPSLLSVILKVMTKTHVIFMSLSWQFFVLS